MKQLKYVVGLFFLILMACKPEKSENRLLGNWYGFDADSSYYELYISDTVIILNHEKLGLAEYVYEKDEDKLVTTTPLFFERVWNLDTLTDSIVVISDTLETHHFFKMIDEIDYFSSLKDSLEFYQFREAFITRNPKSKSD